MPQHNQSLLDALSQCAMACDHCFHACLQEENVKMMTRCIQLDRGCADVCRLTMSFVSANSEFARRVISLCAEICEACYEECSKHTDEHCRRCAEACKRCAEACRAALTE